MFKRFLGLISACFAVLAVISPALAGVAGPTVSIQEDFSLPFDGEYTVSIDSSQTGVNWYIPFFAVSNNSSNIAFVDNNIGNWDAIVLDQQAWDSGFDFNFGSQSPAGFETLVTSTDFGSYASIFGTDAVVNAYWASNYTDYQIGFPGLFSLIGPNETRGGFKFSANAPASQFVALAQNNPGGTGGLTITGSAITVPGPASLPLAALGLLGLAAIARRRRGN